VTLLIRLSQIVTCSQNRQSAASCLWNGTKMHSYQRTLSNCIAREINQFWRKRCIYCFRGSIESFLRLRRNRAILNWSKIWEMHWRHSRAAYARKTRSLVTCLGGWTPRKSITALKMMRLRDIGVIFLPQNRSWRFSPLASRARTAIGAYKWTRRRKRSRS
jgi:hypothetical protein